jgi:GTP pyrophosphokinase
MMSSWKLREGAEAERRDHLIKSIGQGDLGIVQVMKHLYPETQMPDARRSRAARLARRQDARQPEGCAHPGRRWSDGSVCAVLSAGAGRSGCWLRDARAWREHPPRGLSESADARARAGAKTRNRLKELEGERFIVRLVLDATDRRGLYADLAKAVSATDTDIRSFELQAQTVTLPARLQSKSRTWPTSSEF